MFVLCAVYSTAAETFRKFKLDNGLEVYLWEDHNQPDVTGRVVVRAGSVDEPKEYTGLAHYLEHVLFKGTQKIGALDWDKEKPYYESIVKMYDELSQEKDLIKRDTLIQKINKASLAAAKYTKTNEFSNLVEGVIGGKNLNAGTSYDMTVFYSDFPVFQMEKWLEVNSERFINPVFRSFQAELENVFEEYNMYQDRRDMRANNFIFSSLYPNAPYGRDVIGLPEHLKNPKLSKLIEFYNMWYVPENMALILAGNFNSDEIIPMIKEKFGRLKSGTVPQRVSYPLADFSANPVYKAKLSFYPQLIIGFQGVKKGNADELALDVTAQLLSNSANTGLLDRLTLNGDLTSAGVYNDTRREDGRVFIAAIPYYDISRRMYDSDKSTEKILMNEVDKLKNGNFDEWLLQSVKDEMLKNYELMIEKPISKSELLTDVFVYNLPDSYLIDYKTKLAAISVSDIKRVVNNYFKRERVTISIEEGAPKSNKLKKPDIKPIDQSSTETSAYAKWIKTLSTGSQPEVFNDLTTTKKIDLYDGIRLHYTPNPLNDIFRMTIRYGVGTFKMPKLSYAAPLMNYAGIMPISDAKEVRKQYSQLGGQCSFSVDDNYLYVTIEGKEENLLELCKMVTRQILLPKLEDKQLDQIKGAELQKRFSVEKSDVTTMANAMLDYVMYKDKSEYKDRLDNESVFGLKVSELTGEIVRATNYEADIFYVGKMALNDVVDVLKGNLPLKEGIVRSESPVVKSREAISESTIYFLPNTETQQAKIYFYIDGKDFHIADKGNYDVFYQYFSGGFNGLVMDEIREKNSMAYQAYGYVWTPPVQNKKTYFMGYIGTQNDKATDAVNLYLKLLQNMPLYPDRIDAVKNYVKQTYLANKPTFRNQGQVFDSWRLLGYNDDPARVMMPKIESLTFNDIVDFYKNNIKDKPLDILIVGDPKLIDFKKINLNAKIVKLSKESLFKN